MTADYAVAPSALMDVSASAPSRLLRDGPALKDARASALSLVLGEGPAAAVANRQSAEGGTSEGKFTIAVAGSHWIAGGGLRAPIRVAIEVEDTQAVIATEGTTGIFGVGVALADAIVDLRLALVEHRDALEGADQLSAGLEEQLVLLRRMLKDS